MKSTQSESDPKKTKNRLINLIINRDFSRYAIGVLDLSFAQSDLRVYDVLNQKNPDLNDLTVIELAYNSNNKEFLGHACCQIWITKKFYGKQSLKNVIMIFHNVICCKAL